MGNCCPDPWKEEEPVPLIVTATGESGPENKTLEEASSTEDNQSKATTLVQTVKATQGTQTEGHPLSQSPSGPVGAGAAVVTGPESDKSERIDEESVFIPDEAKAPVIEGDQETRPNTVAVARKGKQDAGSAKEEKSKKAPEVDSAIPADKKIKAGAVEPVVVEAPKTAATRARTAASTRQALQIGESPPSSPPVKAKPSAGSGGTETEGGGGGITIADGEETVAKGGEDAADIVNLPSPKASRRRFVHKLGSSPPAAAREDEGEMVEAAKTPATAGNANRASTGPGAIVGPTSPAAGAARAASTYPAVEKHQGPVAEGRDHYYRDDRRGKYWDEREELLSCSSSSSRSRCSFCSGFYDDTTVVVVDRGGRPGGEVKVCVCTRSRR